MNQMTEDKARDIVKALSDIFTAQERILELGGFTLTSGGQWKSQSGDFFWRDGALRIVECNALVALGRNPNEGRQP